MTRLPIVLRFAPFMFYGWAAVVVVAYFVSAWALIEQASYQYGSGMDVPSIFQEMIKSQTFITGISEGAYMAANGAVLHVLIAIYDKMKGPAA